MPSDNGRMARIIEQFTTLAKTQRWLAESSYISDDVSNAIDSSDRFKEVGYRRSGQRLIFEAEWLRTGTFADLHRDFYALYGRFAEDSQFIHQRAGKNGVTFDIMVGDVGRAGGHGHHVEIRLVGFQIRELLRSQKEFVERELKSVRRNPASRE